MGSGRVIVPGFFWEATRRRREEGAGQIESAFMPRLANTAGAGDSYRKRYRAIVRGFFWEVTRLAERNTCQGRGGIPMGSAALSREVRAPRMR